MEPLPQISEAEYEVMRIVWQHAPVSTNEIVEKLETTTSWNPKTIQTLIKRLVTNMRSHTRKGGVCSSTHRWWEKMNTSARRAILS